MCGVMNFAEKLGNEQDFGQMDLLSFALHQGLLEPRSPHSSLASRPPPSGLCISDWGLSLGRYCYIGPQNPQEGLSSETQQR